VRMWPRWKGADRVPPLQRCLGCGGAMASLTSSGIGGMGDTQQPPRQEHALLMRVPPRGSSMCK
jgi:hypothetical protein